MSSQNQILGHYPDHTTQDSHNRSQAGSKELGYPNVRSMRRSKSPQSREPVRYTLAPNSQDDPLAVHEPSTANIRQSNILAGASRQQSSSVDPSGSPSRLANIQKVQTSQVKPVQDASSHQSRNSPAHTPESLHNISQNSLQRQDEERHDTTEGDADGHPTQGAANEMRRHGRSLSPSQSSLQYGRHKSQHRQEHKTSPLREIDPASRSIVRGKELSPSERHVARREQVHVPPTTSIPIRYQKHNEDVAWQQNERRPTSPLQADEVRQDAMLLDGQRAADQYLARKRAQRGRGQLEVGDKNEEIERQVQSTSDQRLSSVASGSASPSRNGSEEVSRTPTCMDSMVRTLSR